MKRINFKVPIYDWDITVIRLQGTDDEWKEVEPIYKEFDADPASAAREIALIKQKAKNGGSTWRDSDARTIVVILFTCDSPMKLLEVFNHEKRHVIDRIMGHCGINDTEAAAYLDGFISTNMWPCIKGLL